MEQDFRIRAGQAGYPGGFIEHYLLPALYPAGLTRPAQWLLGTVVLAINGAVYAWLLWKRKGSRSSLS